MLPAWLSSVMRRPSSNERLRAFSRLTTQQPPLCTPAALICSQPSLGACPQHAARGPAMAAAPCCTCIGPTASQGPAEFRDYNKTNACWLRAQGGHQAMDSACSGPEELRRGGELLQCAGYRKRKGDAMHGQGLLPLQVTGFSCSERGEGCQNAVPLVL